jgi:hypothetical protein
VARCSLRTAEMTTLRVGCRKHTSQSALDPKHHKKEPMHGPANKLNVATWMHESGYYWGVQYVSHYFCVSRPVGRPWHIAQFSTACRRDDLR